MMGKTPYGFCRTDRVPVNFINFTLGEEPDCTARNCDAPLAGEQRATGPSNSPLRASVNHSVRVRVVPAVTGSA